MPDFGNDDPRFDDASNLRNQVASLEKQLADAQQKMGRLRGIASECVTSMVSLIDTICPDSKQDLFDTLSEPTRKFAAKVLGKEKEYARRQYEKELGEYRNALKAYHDMTPTLRKSLRVGLPMKPRKPKILRKPK